MIELPRPVRAWSASLSLFPEEIARALGGMLPRLRGLIGELRPTHARTGDPDGFDGVSQRGDYADLLAQEWLLLDEVPDEFLRRAVAREHLFLRRARAQWTQGRRSVVIFDGGVDCLGGPRIAHLALLILFAQRAASAGASFGWGLLQDPERRLEEQVTQASVRALLGGRSDRRTRADEIAAWVDSVRQERGEARDLELWLVGGSACASAASSAGVASVAVSEVLEPGARRLRVRANGPRGAPREATIELPPERLAVGLIRDPFDAPGHTTRAALRPDPRGGVVFSDDGRLVFTLGPGATLISFPAPNSPRARLGPPRMARAPVGHEIVGAGRSIIRRRAILITRHRARLFVHLLSKRRSSIIETHRFDYPNGDRMARGLRPAIALSGGGFMTIGALDEVLELKDGAARVRRPGPVRAAMAVRQTLRMVELPDGRPPRIVTCGPSTPDDEKRVALSHSTRLSAGAVYLTSYFQDLSAYELRDGTWGLIHGSHCQHLSIEPGRTVLGAVETAGPLHDSGTESARSALITVSPSGARLELFDGSAPRTIAAVGTGVWTAAAGGATGDVAFLGATGELILYSATREAVLARFAPEPEAATTEAEPTP